MTEPTTPTNPSTGRAWLIGLLIVIALGIAIVAGQLWRYRERPIDNIPGKSQPGIPVPPNLPGIQMTEEIKVAPAEALKLNEAVPFVEEPPVPARPFRLSTSTADKNRAIDCLASAIHYEAASEPLEGQMAVAQVVLNRMRHPAFPKTVCGVVYQGSERTDKLCQFSFACDGSLNRVPLASSWARARSVATQMLNGTVYKPVGWATHYHTNWVFPSWSTKLDKVRQEGTHLFFRWKDYWGTPKAFRNRYAGGEMNVGKLAGLSPFHIPEAVPADLALPGTTIQGVTADGTIVNQPLLVPKDPKVLPPPPAFAKLAYSNPTGDYQLYLVGKGIEPEALLSLSIRACGEKDYCKVLMWTDKAAVPAGLPVSDVALKKLSFSYLRNRSTGFEKPLWDCALFNRRAVGQCIKHQQPAAPRPVAPVPAPTTPAVEAAGGPASGT